MTASRKLYNAMAAEFKRIEGTTDEADRHMWTQMVWAASQTLWRDNSGFDRLRFLRASGYSEADVTARGHMF